MKKALFIIILFIGVFALFSKTTWAGDCLGVYKCAVWGLNGNCSSSITSVKVCSGSTEAACYETESPPCGPQYCTVSDCTWTSNPGLTPTPTPIGGGGGGGGEFSCPTGTYSEAQKDCRNECNAGWKPSSGCGPECGKNAQGEQQVCCRKGFCIPEKPQNFSDHNRPYLYYLGLYGKTSRQRRVERPVVFI